MAVSQLRSRKKITGGRYKYRVKKTEKGEARVTSRPGQHGAINAVLIFK